MSDLSQAWRATDAERRWRMAELEPPATGRRTARSPAGPDIGAAADGGDTAEPGAERHAQLDEARRQARQEGYDAGFAAGREAGHARGLEEGRKTGEHEVRQRERETLKMLASLAENFSTALADLDDEVVERMVHLALAVGHQLAGAALQTDERETANLVRGLLREDAMLNGQPRLWLHPDDLDRVRDALGAELDAAGWSLQPDDGIARGGCRVTSVAAELDATVETRWQTLLARVGDLRGGTGRDNGGTA